jgi:hypothetical protein
VEKNEGYLLKSSLRLSMMVCVCNPTQEAEIRRITAQGRPGQKTHKTPSLPIKVGRGGTYLLSQICRKGK